MSDSPGSRLQPRPYGRRSAIVLLIGAAALLVWALTAGDDPALRTVAVGGVVALTIVGVAIRFAHRTIREQREAGAAGSSGAATTARTGETSPDSYQELLHQLDAAVRSRSYLCAVLVPRLEQILESKQRGAAADQVRSDLQRLIAASSAPRWSLAWWLGSRRTTAAALAAVAQDLARLP